ncbi:hypothetical protein LRR81_07945 [Metabacillus sp. GX 13764]|uniref:hypothetical protein n=1 Tax=Metabacillus kandeliae TaxID=2900151 RepID=UPI001E57E379|nr:hypothetical protein [Metabacillus kandeliae]MCD7034162.1 hypothetical protein [Metabacillus kandeliae]
MRIFKIALIVISLLMGTACANTEASKRQGKEYNSEQQAFEAAQKERPDMKRIVWESKIVGSEKIALYYFKTAKGDEGFGFASFLFNDKNNKVNWNSVAPETVTRTADHHCTSVKGGFTSAEGIQFEFYEGVAEQGEKTRIETSLEDGVKPHIDQASGLYYCVTFGPNQSKEK